jgi:hypothetical protein
MDIQELLGRNMSRPELYGLIEWFLKNTLTDYLDQNGLTVVKNIKEDQPPKEIKEFLLTLERNTKKREEVIKCLMV